MTFNQTTINVKDAVGTSKPMIAYNDGTNNAFAHALLDDAGAIVSPATSGKQDTANTALGAPADAAVTNPASSGSIIAVLKGILTAAANLLPKGQATMANSSPVAIASDQTLPLPTGAATAANQTTANTSLSTLATNIPAKGSANSANSLPIVIASDQAAVPVTQSANTSGGTSTYAALGGTGNGLLTNTAVAVKASAGNLYGVDFVNAGAVAAYVQFFDAATGSVTLGTTAPKMAKWVPAGGSWEEKFVGEAKVSFATAITVAATTTPTGSTAPATGIMANIVYK